MSVVFFFLFGSVFVFRVGLVPPVSLSLFLLLSASGFVLVSAVFLCRSRVRFFGSLSLVSPRFFVFVCLRFCFACVSFLLFGWVLGASVRLAPWGWVWDRKGPEARLGPGSGAARSLQGLSIRRGLEALGRPGFRFSFFVASLFFSLFGFAWFLHAWKNDCMDPRSNHSPATPQPPRGPLSGYIGTLG